MNEEQYAKIREDLARNEQEHESYNRRLREHDETLKELGKTQLTLERLSSAVMNLSDGIKDVKAAVLGVDKRVSDLEREPADKWKKISFEILKYIVLAIAGVALGYFIKGA